MYRTYMGTIDFDRVKQELLDAASLDDLEALRLSFLGGAGLLTQALKALGKLEPALRPQEGARLNALKREFQDIWSARHDALKAKAQSDQIMRERVDVTRPAPPLSDELGSYHPLSFAMTTMIRIFEGMGFSTRQGPDIEDDDHNFTALNIPDHHPARLSHDTFYLQDAPYLLRTHTSCVQIRTLENEAPPLRIIAPGKVYRDDYDATHTPMFHQIEGLVIENDIHMGHLKGCLETFLNAFFDRPLTMRFRPNFFPFTEPSAEVDILFKNQGSNKSRHDNTWMEVLGCGMVHPNVLKHMGLDPSITQGFAFGLGVERLTMLKYGIDDLRAFFNNDTRWVHQFGFFKA
jgi:phenylalanyl-tRNA synthetase alpha chain